MEQILVSLEERFHCRKTILRELVSYINEPIEAYPDAIHLFGHAGTGKTAIIKYLMLMCKRQYANNFHYAYVNCVECYTTKLLVHNILEELEENGCTFGLDINDKTCKNLKDFLDILRSLHQLQNANTTAFVICLDNAERLRDMEMNVLPILMRLQKLTALNICVVLISQLNFEKFYTKNGLTDPLTLYLPQYNKNEMLQILNHDFMGTQGYIQKYIKQQHLPAVQQIDASFVDNYLNIFLSVFFKACRELPELRITARKCFLTYMEPVLTGSIAADDVSRLWRHIAIPLRTALSQVYLRFDEAAAKQQEEEQSGPSVHHVAQALELPYYGKYLLIAAFLASYNSPKYDKRLYVKNHGKQRKRLQTVNAKAKTTDKMSTVVGPKSFTIDRLLAIFYAILEEKVGLTCNLLAQISSLVHLKLLTFVSGEQNVMDGTARLQCTVSLEFVLCIGKVVSFNVRQYLCDFM